MHDEPRNRSLLTPDSCAAAMTFVSMRRLSRMKSARYVSLARMPPTRAARARGEHVRRPLDGKESLHIGLPPQVELGARALEDVLEPFGDEPSPDGGTYETAMTSDEDTVASVHSYDPR